MQPVNIIPAQRYQLPEVETKTMMTEIYIPSYKLVLNVFGEIFPSEKTRYKKNLVVDVGGMEFHLGDLPNNEITIDRYTADRLLRMENKSNRSPDEENFVQTILSKYFPPKTRPDTKAVAERQKILTSLNKSTSNPKPEEPKLIPSAALAPIVEPIVAPVVIQNDHDMIQFDAPIIEPVKAQRVVQESPKVPEPKAPVAPEPPKAPEPKAAPVAKVAQQLSKEEEELYCCPISHDIMRDPWMDPEGNSYEKDEIFSWLEKNATSPITRKPLRREELAPNRVLKNIIKLKFPE